MIDHNPNTERLVALVSPEVKQRVEEIAEKNPRFWTNFQPSNTAVVREALEFFLGHCVLPDGTIRDMKEGIS